MPSGDKGWNCSSTTVLCLVLVGGKDIQDDCLALKNGSLMLTAERANKKKNQSKTAKQTNEEAV